MSLKDHLIKLGANHRSLRKHIRNILAASYEPMKYLRRAERALEVSMRKGPLENMRQTLQSKVADAMRYLDRNKGPQALEVLVNMEGDIEEFRRLGKEHGPFSVADTIEESVEDTIEHLRYWDTMLPGESW